VLEFNCRFGDPETQPILMRLESDLVDVLEATVEGTLDRVTLAWRRDPAVCVVLASGGYPSSYEKGMTIRGLGEASAIDDVEVFHSGTILQGTDVVTAGGRVLCVTATGATFGAARARVYQAARLISFDGVTMRGDICERVADR
jgi:phosphoribosylamine--glycine ligase